MDLNNAPGIEFVLQHLPEIVDKLDEKLGREAIDFVKESTEPKEFRRLLAQVLYSGRAIEELPVPPLQRQIAAMNRALIFTTNYDPLIELALMRIQDGVRLDPLRKENRWEKYRKGLEKRPKPGFVHHLHGYLSPEGQSEGAIVLSEGDYFDLFGSPKKGANRAILDLLRSEGALLILGMSLSDPNIRRLLYEGRFSKSPVDSQVYAVMRSNPELASIYERSHWKNRKVTILGIQDFDQIDELLRMIKFGRPETGSNPPWLERSLRYVAASIPAVFSNSWQEKAHQRLIKLREQLEILFPLAHGERIDIGFLVPHGDSAEEAALAIVARTQERPGNEEEARARARLFSFGLRFSQEQGCSGPSFCSGVPREALNDDKRAHLRVERSTREQWYRKLGYQEWRSILTVPILDSKDWVPVAALSLTSNRHEPFWAAKPEHLPELKSVLRGFATKYLLGNADLS